MTTTSDVSDDANHSNDDNDDDDDENNNNEEFCLDCLDARYGPAAVISRLAHFSPPFAPPRTFTILCVALSSPRFLLKLCLHHNHRHHYHQRRGPGSMLNSKIKSR